MSRKWVRVIIYDVPAGLRLRIGDPSGEVLLFAHKNTGGPPPAHRWVRFEIEALVFVDIQPGGLELNDILRQVEEVCN